ncbi:MAG TPA: threonine synthase [Longimicrobiaceae bacterium]|nr:threonine synthase [Longimicrobiaceae bacterium]
MTGVPTERDQPVAMKYVSTRGAADGVSPSAAIERGIAPDGGLYVPERFPSLSLSDFGLREGVAEIGRVLLSPFFEGDPLADRVGELCDEAFDFPIPLRPLRGESAVLELFHGPTAAFKDVGARFLAAALARLRADAAEPLTILVATSGDTGGAVAAAFHGRPGFRVVVLYPKGRVSPRQEKQLTGWGGNVHALAVRGDFDDCQRMVKEAFADEDLRTALQLSSANSINLGRLLPQMVYYADASLRYLREHGSAPGFIVPSGNLGNAVACLWAQRAGLPIREVALATNDNATISEYFASGQWQPRPTVETLATAMDVGAPSNFERMQSLFGSWAQAHRHVRAIRVSDEAIREEIRQGPERWGTDWDPHTATAAAAFDQLPGDAWVLVSTAHPAKFEQVVEPLLGRTLPVPPALGELLGHDAEAPEVAPTLDALREVLGRLDSPA